jgi:phosphate starvation-inducible protein PhoH and related proteins
LGKHVSSKSFHNKCLGKKRRRHAQPFETAEIIEFQGKFETERVLPPIKALNPTQSAYLDALRVSPQVIVLGPAGTGKTWIAATHAADLYRNRRIDKIILTRPNVPCGRSLGYFPGTIEEKFAPWAAPVIEAIKERMGKAAYEIALKNGDIELLPFEVMRGRSWKDAFVLLDEAQNSTVTEIKTFLTRIGENCTVVINGDVSQCDLEQASGLATAIHLIKSQMLPVPVIQFTRDDIVRSGTCAMWVRAFDEASL